MKNIKVASFLEAFKKFLSYSDGSLSINTLSSFAKLKEEKKIEFENETQFWCGNHHRAYDRTEMFYITEPCIFFVVKNHYYENSDNSYSRTETTIFVPNEN
jgi:hypothetical protein